MRKRRTMASVYSVPSRQHRDMVNVTHSNISAEQDNQFYPTKASPNGICNRRCGWRRIVPGKGRLLRPSRPSHWRCALSVTCAGLDEPAGDQQHQRHTVRPARNCKAKPRRPVRVSGPQRGKRLREAVYQGCVRFAYLHFSPEAVVSYWLLSRPDASAGKVDANCLSATQPRWESPSWRIDSASSSRLSGARSPLGSVL